jgi:hypothetical protein
MISMYTVILATPAGIVYGVLRKLTPEQAYTIACDRLASNTTRVFVVPTHDPPPTHENRRSWTIH